MTDFNLATFSTNMTSERRSSRRARRGGEHGPGRQESNASQVWITAKANQSGVCLYSSPCKHKFMQMLTVILGN